jgi:hypothetical protein
VYFGYSFDDLLPCRGEQLSSQTEEAGSGIYTTEVNDFRLKLKTL